MLFICFKRSLGAVSYTHLDVYKRQTESPPRYLVFFKGRDADVLTVAFKEFSAKKLTQEKKPSIRNLLSTLKEAAQGKNAERAKVKNKDREVSL